MNIVLLDAFEYIGVIAFAISGAFVGIRKQMDVFGVNVLAITTACGGGLMRDIIIGRTPPNMFQNPIYVCIAAVFANLVFALAYYRRLPEKWSRNYDKMLFWFDTLGLAAFATDGVMLGVQSGYQDNSFLLVFLGFMSAVGGGALRDVLANQTPDIFRKRIYALASILGGILMTTLHSLLHSWKIAMLGGFAAIILLRWLAAHYRWNLPRMEEEPHQDQKHPI